MKTCCTCKIEKELEAFYNYKKAPDGKTYQCKECMELYRASHRQRQVEYMRNLREDKRNEINAYKRDLYLKKDPRRRMLHQMVGRARAKGLEHTITIDDIVIPDICPILKIPFIRGTRDNYEHTYSLDRIDNRLGYIPGNIQVISKKANSMKNSGTPEELLLLADWIYKTFK